MAHLKFYENENEIYREAYERKLTPEEIEIIFAKLIRHFKLKNYSLEWSRRGSGGTHSKNYWGGVITVPYGCSALLLCHEIAHGVEYIKRGCTKHDKKLMRVIGRVVAYCDKKEWWAEEIHTRTVPKLEIPKPSKEEERAAKIIKQEEAILRYEKKLQRYTKFYTNKISKAKRSVAALKRHEAKAKAERDVMCYSDSD